MDIKTIDEQIKDLQTKRQKLIDIEEDKLNNNVFVLYQFELDTEDIKWSSVEIIGVYDTLKDAEDVLITYKPVVDTHYCNHYSLIIEKIKLNAMNYYDKKKNKIKEGEY